jgi:hypothetical protein
MYSLIALLDYRRFVPLLGEACTNTIATNQMYGRAVGLRMTIELYIGYTEG